MKRMYRKVRYKVRQARKARIFNIIDIRALRNLRWTDVKRFLKSKEAWKIFGLAGLSGLGILLGIFGYFAKDLPDPNKINARHVKQSTKILDRGGNELYQVYGDVKRTLIPFEEMPQNCKNATIVKEDRDFYKHHGFVPRSFARAVTSNLGRLIGRGRVEGGSTITQQMVKNVLLSPERSLTRKIKELILAIEIEQLYKKDEILKIYLNEIPYGSNAYGLEAAAKTYFDKSAKNLSLEECAVIAALPQAPTYYSPFGQHKDDLLAQKDRVLDEMAKEGLVKKDEADAAKAKPVNFTQTKERLLAPHFVLYVKEQLVAKYGEKLVTEGGLKVTTTLDYGLNTTAENVIRNNAGAMGKAGASNASLVSIDPRNGHILAMVGSKDYFDTGIDGNVNISLTLQQPGSSLKPIIYGFMFKQPDRWGRTWGPGSVLYDVNTDFGGAPAFRPKNYDLKDHGVVTVRKALANSYNIPAVKTLYIAGIDESVKNMKELGYKSSTIDANNCGLSLVLGGCEVTLLDHTSAYATVANKGDRFEPVTILKVEDANGKVLEQWKPKAGQKVLDEQVSYLVSDILSDTEARTPTFSSRTFSIGRKAAAKTGTTDDFKDAWTMGFVPQIATGVWVGNNDNRPLKRSGSGAMVAEPIWRQFMQQAVSGMPSEWHPRPKGIKNVELDNTTGAKPDGGGGVHNDIFPEWFQPMEPPGSAKTYAVDTVSGGMADLGNCAGGTNRAGEPRTPPDAQGKIFTGRIAAEIPPSDPAYPRWQAGVAKLGGGTPAPTFDDNVHKCSDIPPEITAISLIKSGSSIIVKVTVDKGTYGITKAQIWIDDVYKGDASCSGGGIVICSLTVPSPGTGSHKYTAKAVDQVLYADSRTENLVTPLV